MSHTVSAAAVVEVLRVFCGNYDVELQDGRLRLLGRLLPGKAVCAILPDTGDGVLRVVYDVSKPNCFAHAQEMVREWWESYREPEVFPDGSVELLARPAPQPREAEPVRIHVYPRLPVD